MRQITAAVRRDPTRTTAPSATARTRASGSQLASVSTSWRCSAVRSFRRPLAAICAARSDAEAAVTGPNLCGRAKRLQGCVAGADSARRGRSVSAIRTGRHRPAAIPRRGVAQRTFRSANSARPATAAVASATPDAVERDEARDLDQCPGPARPVDGHVTVGRAREPGRASRLSARSWQAGGRWPLGCSLVSARTRPSFARHASPEPEVVADEQPPSQVPPEPQPLPTAPAPYASQPYESQWPPEAPGDGEPFSGACPAGCDGSEGSAR